MCESPGYVLPRFASAGVRPRVRCLEWVWSIARSEERILAIDAETAELKWQIADLVAGTTSTGLHACESCWPPTDDGPTRHARNHA
jgi:hypothetical protein